MITPTYKVVNDGEMHELSITVYIENEAEPEWVGVHIIEIMTQEAEPDRFKWKDEVNDLGIYIPVRECAGSNLAICRNRGV